MKTKSHKFKGHFVFFSCSLLILTNIIIGWRHKTDVKLFCLNIHLRLVPNQKKNRTNINCARKEKSCPELEGKIDY